MGETDDEMRWKLDEDIAAFKQKIEQLLKEYESAALRFCSASYASAYSMKRSL